MNKTNIVIIAIVIAAIAFATYLSYGPKDTVLVPPTQPSPSTVVPTPSAPQAKININAVCDGALAYMTFPDGASAEVFVKDCKEGKHPEVIEKWKASLNVGAGAAI